MTWRLAKCLEQLLAELDTAYPHRPKDSDGTIGDAAHAARVSDHNPNHEGVVTAVDITTADFTDSLAEVLRSMGRHGDGRVKYVIYKHRIASIEHDWSWRVYNGLDPHESHIHLSVSSRAEQYDRDDEWPLNAITITDAPPAQKEDDDMTPAQATQLREVRKIAATTDARVDRLEETIAAIDKKLDALLAKQD